MHNCLLRSRARGCAPGQRCCVVRTQGSEDAGTVKPGNATARSTVSDNSDDSTYRITRTVPRAPPAGSDDGTVRRYTDTVRAGNTDTVKVRGDWRRA